MSLLYTTRLPPLLVGILAPSLSFLGPRCNLPQRPDPRQPRDDQCHSSTFMAARPSTTSTSAQRLTPTSTPTSRSSSIT
eukprot:2321187-Amphidinium_carterae.2